MPPPNITYQASPLRNTQPRLDIYMLILKRRTSEHLRIGASVSITVLEVKGIQVKIGLHARTPLPLQ
ncbi:carbon storage regulator [Microbulbifer sp. TRSA007]|uniref:carbon storage regulator n=1 Tax=Microbulbifer sp. TRSA007 TaxID=3243384 RepID=UPI0040392921